MTFKDKAEVINEIISKKRNKWQLSALADIDFEDVSQIIRIHIFMQWDQWDQSRPIENWANKIADNQIKNIIRNNYGKFAPPCSGSNGPPCPCALPGNRCSFTKSGEQCRECPLYKKWDDKKKPGYHMRLSSSLEQLCSEEGSETMGDIECPYPDVNLEEKVELLHKKMLEVLPAKLKEVYQILYIDHLSEDVLADKFGLTCSEKNRKPGYKQIGTYKLKIAEIARNVLKNEDIFLNGY